MATIVIMGMPDLVARLTDSVPPIASPVEVLRRICAWCVDFNPTAAANKNATHMICPACFQRVMAAEGGSR